MPFVVWPMAKGSIKAYWGKMACERGGGRRKEEHKGVLGNDSRVPSFDAQPLMNTQGSGNIELIERVINI